MRHQPHTPPMDTTAASAETRLRTVSPALPAGKKRSKNQTKKERVLSTQFNLQLDINDLRQQIQQLTAHQSLVRARRFDHASRHYRHNPNGAAHEKINQLFCAFNHAYRVQSDSPLAFIRALTGGSTRLFDYWREYTECFASRSCDVRSIRVISTGDDDTYADPGDRSCVVRVEGLSHGLFTMTALHAVYPAVLHDSQLTQQLVDRAKATPMLFHFYFARNGHLESFEAEGDWFTALAQALGDPIRAASLLASNTTDREARRVSNADVVELHEISDVESVAEHDVAERDPRHSVDFLLR